MACKECKERRKMARDALLRAAVGEAAVHVAKGAAEATGLKPKTATKEAKSKRQKAVPADTEQE